jgi:hypothetical protein
MTIMMSLAVAPEGALQTQDHAHQVRTPGEARAADQAADGGQGGGRDLVTQTVIVDPQLVNYRCMKPLRLRLSRAYGLLEKGL